MSNSGGLASPDRQPGAIPLMGIYDPYILILSSQNELLWRQALQACLRRQGRPRGLTWGRPRRAELDRDKQTNAYRYESRKAVVRALAVDFGN